MNIKKAYRTPNSFVQKRNFACHTIIKTLNVQNKKCSQGKTSDLSKLYETLTRYYERSWLDLIQSIKEYKSEPRILYTEKLSITIDEENKIFHDKIKFTQYLFANPGLQRFIFEKCQQKDGNYTLEKARK